MKAKNEMGVIAAFIQWLPKTDWGLESIQSAFPDAIIIHTITGEKRRVEFEYKSSNFRAHGHDANCCDLIVCWIHDWFECPLPVWPIADMTEKVYMYSKDWRKLTDEQKAELGKMTDQEIVDAVGISLRGAQNWVKDLKAGKP